MSTNEIFYIEGTPKFTAYCDDDSGETEIGPCVYDKTNHQFEIHCNDTDFEVVYDETTGKFEARNVDSACCGTPCEECGTSGFSKYYLVYFWEIGNCEEGDCDVFNGNFYVVGPCVVYDSDPDPVNHFARWNYSGAAGTIELNIAYNKTGSNSNIDVWDNIGSTLACFYAAMTDMSCEGDTNIPNERSCSGPHPTQGGYGGYCNIFPCDELGNGCSCDGL